MKEDDVESKTCRHGFDRQVFREDWLSIMLCTPEFAKRRGRV